MMVPAQTFGTHKTPLTKSLSLLYFLDDVAWGYCLEEKAFMKQVDLSAYPR